MKIFKLILSILTFKKSIFLLLAFLVFLMSCTTAEKQWEEAKSKNTVEGYELFLSKYPESEFAQEALNVKVKLEEKNLWGEAKSKNTIEGYELFLSKYPESEFAQEALNVKVKLEEKNLWGEAKSKNTIEGYELFLSKYPESEYSNNAQIAKSKLEWENFSEPFLTEETHYNKYGLYDKIVLKNSKEVIAEKIPFRSPYNPTQITGIGYSYPGEKTLFFIIDYQNQFKESETVSHNDMLLCIDKKGRITKENGKPKLIEAFNAKQKNTFKNKYDGASLTKKITKIYPCKNCSHIKNCQFVW